MTGGSWKSRLRSVISFLMPGQLHPHGPKPQQKKRGWLVKFPNSFVLAGVGYSHTDIILIKPEKGMSFLPKIWEVPMKSSNLNLE